MRLAVHAGTLRGEGSSHVGRQLIQSLSATPASSDLLAWVPAEWDLKVTSSGRCELIGTRPGMARKLALECVEIPLRLARWKAEALLSLGDTSAVRPRVPHVLFVQQSYLAYPGPLRFPLPPGFRAKLRLMSSYFAAGLAGVSQFVVQSETMARWLASRWTLPLERISVIPSGVEPAPITSGVQTGAPYVCYVASSTPHKNHSILSSAVRVASGQFRDLRCKLTVHQADVPDLVREASRLRVLDRFDFLGPVARDDAMRLMSGAAAVIIPSRLESFGLTYYEAMALGKPIVAADEDFAREACGDAAIYCASASGESFGAAIATLFDSPAMRERLSASAKRRFDTVNRPWSSVAEDFRRVLYSAR